MFNSKWLLPFLYLLSQLLLYQAKSIAAFTITLLHHPPATTIISIEPAAAKTDFKRLLRCSSPIQITPIQAATVAIPILKFQQQHPTITIFPFHERLLLFRTMTNWTKSLPILMSISSCPSAAAISSNNKCALLLFHNHQTTTAIIIISTAATATPVSISTRITTTRHCLAQSATTAPVP